jgi:hypothetical protein
MARRVPTALAVAAGSAFLFVRVAPDVASKPLHQDEALAALVAARPLPEMLATVLVDRGGAPLHFTLAHATLELDASSEALRWLSVVFAVLAVALCHDLGRRLAGTVGGITAALLAGTSQLLAVYGSFGRMYALFAFAAALAVDLFARALELRTAGPAAAATAGGWMLAAAHPYGGLVVAAGAVVAVAIWRGRPVRPAIPTAVIGLAFVPLAFANVRLADRFSVGEGGGAGLADPEHAARLFVRALGGVAGGREPLFLVFAALGVIGLATLARRAPAFAAFTVLSLASVPLLLVAGSSGGDVADRLSTRHFLYALPLWTALVSTGVARVLQSRPPAVAVIAVGLVVAAAVLAPSVVEDPRELRSGTRQATAAPAAWLREHVERRDVLFPSAPVFLAALSATKEATPLSRGQPALVRRALERAHLPAESVHLAVPLDFAKRIDPAGLQQELGAAYTVNRWEFWLLVTAHGPFGDRPALARAAAIGWIGATTAIETGSPRLIGYLDQGRTALCGTVESLGGTCAAP